MSKLLLVQGALYALIGALTPVSAVLASDTILNTRSVVAMTVLGLVAGATALKAFLSTTFAESKESVPPK